MSKTLPVFNILIIEDKQSNVIAIKEAVKNFPEFNIIGETDSESIALTMVISKNPDIIITGVDINEGCGISFLRTIRSDKNMTSRPYLIAATSFTSEFVRSDLKQFADKIYIKNIDFNFTKIFIDLSFRKFSQLNDTQFIDFDNIKVKKIKRIIKEELKKYYINPKRKLHRNYLVDMIYLHLQNPSLKLKELREQVTSENNLKSEKNLHTVINRYIAEIFDLTSEKILIDIAFPYSSLDKPSVQLFIFHIADKIRSQTA